MINNFNLEKCPLCGAEVEATVNLVYPAQIKIECPKCHVKLEEPIEPSMTQEGLQDFAVACRIAGNAYIEKIAQIKIEDLFRQVSAVVNKWNNR